MVAEPNTVIGQTPVQSRSNGYHCCSFTEPFVRIDWTMMHSLVPGTGSILALESRPDCTCPIFVCTGRWQEKPCFHLYAANVLGRWYACPSLSRVQIHTLFIRRSATNDVSITPCRHGSIFDGSTVMNPMDEISMFASFTTETIRYDTGQ